MDCDTFRHRIEAEPQSAAVMEHLAACPACRAEAEWGRRLSIAVAAIPHVPAPPALAAAVMADLRPLRPLSRPAGSRPTLLLRRWELGWLGAVCLLLAAWVKTAAVPVLAPVTASVSLWLSSATALPASTVNALSALRAWILSPASSLGSSRELVTPWTGASLAWTCGAVAFALGLFVLLSWHSGAGRTDTWEDAHA